jgi:DNA polymerase III alpha subunit
MPDFDVDFCQTTRFKVIDYVSGKYGKDKVGQIITFGSLKAKSVLRDVCRVFNLPFSEGDKIAKLVPDILASPQGRHLRRKAVKEARRTSPASPSSRSSSTSPGRWA